jgi:hypothetical protein
VARWQLFRGTEAVAVGNAGSCEAPQVAIAATVAPGPYRLEIDLFADQDGEERLSDGVSLDVTLTEPSGAGQPR